MPPENAWTQFPAIAVIVLAVVILLKIVFDYRLRENRESQPQRVSSGEKDPAYWQMEFRTAVREVNRELIPVMAERLRECLAEERKSRELWSGQERRKQ